MLFDWLKGSCDGSFFAYRICYTSFHQFLYRVINKEL